MLEAIRRIPSVILRNPPAHVTSNWCLLPEKFDFLWKRCQRAILTDFALHQFGCFLLFTSEKRIGYFWRLTKIVTSEWLQITAFSYGTFRVEKTVWPIIGSFVLPVVIDDSLLAGVLLLRFVHTTVVIGQRALPPLCRRLGLLQIHLQVLQFRKSIVCALLFYIICLLFELLELRF